MHQIRKKLVMLTVVEEMDSEAATMDVERSENENNDVEKLGFQQTRRGF